MSFATLRWESMWHALSERVDGARNGPITPEAERVLLWLVDTMDTIWNEHRMMDDEGDVRELIERAERFILPVGELEDAERMRAALNAVLHDAEEYHDAETRLKWIRDHARQGLGLAFREVAE